VKLPDELPETPYEVVAFRVHHFHVDDTEDDAYPGTVLIEVGANLPGTEAEIVVPLEMSAESAIGLVDELLHQYRCLEFGIPDEGEGAEEP
jgi:hypothetical protein